MSRVLQYFSEVSLSLSLWLWFGCLLGVWFAGEPLTRQRCWWSFYWPTITLTVPTKPTTGGPAPFHFSWYVRLFKLKYANFGYLWRILFSYWPHSDIAPPSSSSSLGVVYIVAWIVGSQTQEEKHLFYDDDSGLLSQRKKIILVIEHTKSTEIKEVFANGERSYFETLILK